MNVFLNNTYTMPHKQTASGKVLRAQGFTKKTTSNNITMYNTRTHKTNWGRGGMSIEYQESAVLCLICSVNAEKL